LLWFDGGLQTETVIQEHSMLIKTAIVWFRQDLRLQDNPALQVACSRAQNVLPVFILDPALPLGGASRWWLHHSLASLARSLAHQGSQLYIAQGPAQRELEHLIATTGATAVFWNRCFEPTLIARDTAIKTALHDQGLIAESFNALLLREPWQVKTKTGTPYKVFTPFWRSHQAIGPMPPPVAAAPLKPPPPFQTTPLESLQLLPHIPWDSGLKETWVPGETGAHSRLETLVTGPLKTYHELRNLPDQPGTSLLSPHLHFGEISPRQIWHRVQKALQQGEVPSGMGSVTFLNEIGWREFAYHLLYHFPQTVDTPLNPAFAAFPWRQDPKGLKAWQKGMTGYPIVDAGMRQLWHTGWMHNRVRMIVASFLTKDLILPWQQGAEWFWDTLVDADLASNTLGWQWAAGCGADAAPYFRIFNPITQGEKFDPDGQYVRRWLPELAALPAKWIHKPWAAPEEVLSSARVKLGVTYPEPMVDHAQARLAALAAYKEIAKRP
jgi:deoxyribodipyrimidine photo-lyase